MKILLHITLLILLGLTSCFAKNTIIGSVTTKSGETIPYANVIIYDSVSSELVEGVITTEEGTYLFEDIPNGTYFIEVSTLGFGDEKSAIFKIEDEDKEMDFVLVVESLDEVVVVHKRPVIKQTPEKLTVDFERTQLVSTNLRDVMRKIPGVVITNNDLSYAGQRNIRVLINGQTTDYLDVGALLREIPASNISKVEVINQPGPEYDAEGATPLINIILKKNAKLGTHGSVAATLAYTDDIMYGTNASFSRYKNNLNIQASIGILKSSWREDLFITRTVENETYEQTSIAPEQPISYNSGIGLDYKFNDFHSIGINGRSLYTISERTTDNITVVSSQDSTNTLFTDNIFDRSRTNFSMNPYYEFSNDQNSFTADFNYVNYEDSSENALLKTEESEIEYLNRKYIQAIDYDIFTYKADYWNQASNVIRWGLGSKYTDVSSESDLESFIENEGGEFIENEEQSNTFIIDESIFALYGKVTVGLEDWSSVIGLRWEKSNTVGTSVLQDISNERDISELFPSITLSRKLNENLGLSLAYNRRIERPAYSSLNSFVLFYDAFTFEQGNPGLRPSFTNNFQIALTNKEQPFLSVNYGSTQDALFQILTQDNETAEIARTTINLSKYTYWNIKLFTPLSFINKVDGHTGLILNNNDYQSANLTPEYDRDKWGLTWFLNASYQLPWEINSEVSATYTTGGLEGQVEYRDLAGLDIALSKSFLEDRLTVTMQFSDIVNTPFRGNLNYDTINANIENNGVGQNFYLKLGYSFGTGGKEQEPRNNVSEEEENRIDSNN